MPNLYEVAFENLPPTTAKLMTVDSIDTMGEQCYWMKKRGLKCLAHLVWMGIAVTFIALLTYKAADWFGFGSKGNTIDALVLRDLKKDPRLAKILNSVDDKIVPCDNFYQYTCSGFLNKTQIPSNKQYVNQYTRASDAILKQLQSFMEKEITNSEPQDYAYVRSLYNTCMKDIDREESKFEVLKTHINQLGGWPLIQEHNWKGEGFNWKDMFIRLNELGYAPDYLPRIGHVEPLSTHYALFMYPPINTFTDGELDDTDFSSKISEEINNMEKMSQKLYSKSINCDYTGTCRAAMDFGIKLAKVIRDNHIPQPPYSATWMSTFINKKEVGHTGLRQTVQRYIKKLVNETDIQLWFFFNTEQQAKIFEYLNEQEKTNKEDMANYMIWRAIKDSMKKLDYTQDKSAECVTQISDVLNVIVHNIYVKEYGEKSKTLERKLHHMFVKIKSGFNSTLSKVVGMTNETLSASLIKLNSMKLRIDLPRATNQSNQKYSYPRLTDIQSKNFHEIMSHLRILNNKNNIRKLEQPVDPNDWISRINVMDSRPHYDSHSNTIFLPPVSYQSSSFDQGNNCSFMNFGGLGVDIAHSMAHALEELLSTWTGSKKQLLKSVNHDEKMVWKEIMDRMRIFKDDGLPQGYQPSDFNLEEHFIDIFAIKSIYRGYEKLLLDSPWCHSKELWIRIPHMKWFWLSTVYARCEKSSIPIDKQTMDHHLERSRLHFALSMIKEFSVDFHCPNHTKLNPTSRLQLGI